MVRNDIVQLIKSDDSMMEILRTVEKLHLPDWYVGAGFIRGKVWDTLHGYTTRTLVPDIDVIYYDKNDFSKEEESKDTTTKEVAYENKLKEMMPEVNWSVTNQARMHVFHDDKQYSSSEEALSRWVETATCVGIKTDKDNMVLSAPRGIDDLVNLILRPTNTSEKNVELFYKRIKDKRWLEKWPKLRVAI